MGQDRSQKQKQSGKKALHRDSGMFQQLKNLLSEAKVPLEMEGKILQGL